MVVVERVIPAHLELLTILFTLDDVENRHDIPHDIWKQKWNSTEEIQKHHLFIINKSNKKNGLKL
jgi:hypothetical protein